MTFVVPGIEQWGYTSYQDHSRSQHVPQPYYGFLTQRNSQILEGHRSSMGLSACGPESSVPDETGLNFTPKNFGLNFARVKSLAQNFATWATFPRVLQYKNYNF